MQGIAKPVSVYATALGAQQAADSDSVADFTEPLSNSSPLRSTGTAEKILGRPCEVKGVVEYGRIDSSKTIKNRLGKLWSPNTKRTTSCDLTWQR